MEKRYLQAEDEKFVCAFLQAYATSNEAVKLQLLGAAKGISAVPEKENKK